jgi:hypothetical protein
MTRITQRIAVGELPDAPTAAVPSAGVTAPGDGVVSVPVGGLLRPPTVPVRADDLEPGDRIVVGGRAYSVTDTTDKAGMVVLSLRTDHTRWTCATDEVFEVIR